MANTIAAGGRRSGPALELGLLAALLSAAKALLYTAGNALFLGREGALSMPGFYIGFAVLATAGSAAFARVVDRVPAMRLVRLTLIATAVAAPALRVGLALELPGGAYAVLAAGHLYDIATDIVFWVAAGLYLTSYAMRRATPALYLALAGGGVVGGVLAGLLVRVLPTEDLLLAAAPFALAAALQSVRAERRLAPVEEADVADEETTADDAGGLFTVLRRHPFGALLAVNGLMLTLVYSLTEFLSFAAYERAFADEARLAAFLGGAFAAVQAAEFVLLVTIGRGVLERLGPFARNLLFPVTSLVCLIALALNQRLPAALAAHVNTEALSNAVFEPVNNANYAALPRRLHGRVRTLADGVLYPIGMALGGFVLIAVGGDAGLTGAALAAALLAASAFALVNAALGARFLPALVCRLRDGVPDFRAFRGPAPSAADIRRLLRAPDAEAARVGFHLMRGLGPEDFLDDLAAALPRLEVDDRWAAVDLFARTPKDLAGRFVAGLLREDEPFGHRVALAVLLARRERPAALTLARLRRSPDPVVSGLAAAMTTDGAVGLDPPPGSAAPAEATRAALIGLSTAPPDGEAGAVAAAFAARALGRPEPAIRAEAATALGALAGASGPMAGRAADALATALEDRDARVRRRAVEALPAHGDRGVDAVVPRLAAARPVVVEAAAHALGRVGTRRARAALRAFLTSHHAGLEASPGDAPDDLDERRRRAVEATFLVLEALGEGRTVAQLRRAFRSADPRTRADALEALTSLPHRRLLRPVQGLLERRLAARPSDPAPPSSPTAGARPSPAVAVRLIPPAHRPDAAVQNVLILRQVSYFGALPFDTLIALARVVERRAYAAGETICVADSFLDHLHILVEGAIELDDGERGPSRVTAPSTFGEDALLDERAPAPRAVAVEAAVVLRLHRVVFHDLLQDHPEVLMDLCRALARRLRAARPAATPLAA